MKKIIGIIHPFDIYQTLYVYEDGKELENIQTRMKDLPKTVLDLSNTYKTYDVDLSGAQYFTKNIIKKIQEEEMLKYNEYKLTIRCI